MLLGSTEWAETHAAELKKKGLVYINTDGNGRGFLNVEGSHSLENYVARVATDVVGPEVVPGRSGTIHVLLVKLLKRAVTVCMPAGSGNSGSPRSHWTSRRRGSCTSPRTA